MKGVIVGLIFFAFMAGLAVLALVGAPKALVGLGDDDGEKDFD